ncbi:hypothetical protein ACFS6H_05135 [Terrimonas rubra]|uniref:YD repeat-containing protein n=1 Tax=Terrimonas rubra TaxID=1035890 RepID=A0ABW6A1F4_9BACT
MNRIFLTVLLAGIFFLEGCIKTPVSSPQVLLTKWTYVGTGTRKYDYDSERRLTFSTYIPVKGAGSTFHYSDFNTSGAPMYYYFSHASDPANIIHYRPEYDESGRLSIVNIYDAANNLTEYKKYNYLPGQVVQHTYAATGILTTEIRHYVNAAGNITTSDFYNGSGTLQQRRTYSLFDDKKSVKSLLPAVEGRDSYSENNYQAYTIFDGFTGITHSYTCAYAYNARDFVTRQTITNSTTGSVSVQTFDYVITP